MSKNEFVLAQQNYNHPAFRKANPSNDDIDINIPLFQQYLNTCKQYPDATFIAHRAGLATHIKPPKTSYETITYKQSTVIVQEVQKLLTEIGVQQSDRVAIYASNSPLWLLVDLCITSLNAYSSSLYDTLGLDNIIYCLKLLKCNYIVTSLNFYPQIVAISHLIPDLKGILVLGDYIGQEEKLLNKALLERNHIDIGILVRDDTKSMYSMGTQLHSTLGQGEVEPEKVELDEKVVTYIKNIINREDQSLKVMIIPTQYDYSEENKQVEALESLQTKYSQLKQDINDIAALLFTSGTSGHPKCVLLSHKNVSAAMHVSGYRQKPGHLSRSGTQTRLICYLPLAHAFERAECYGAIIRGIAIYFSSGDIRKLSEDLQLSQPTMMIGVPRVYTKMYHGLIAKLNKKNFIARRIFWTAWKIKKFYLKVHPSAYLTGKMPIIDLVFKPIQQALGGKMEFVVSGSSTMPKQVREFLRICTGAQLNIGYGMTETTCTGLYNHAGQRYFEQGETGHCSHDTIVKLVDASQICEFQLQRDKVGEFCIKGPGVSIGYLDGEWGNIKQLVDSDGFYHTGDLGKIMPDGSGSFVRRINFVVKLQQGEFVDLERIEQVLETNPLIQQALVHAEPDKSAPIAILSLDGSALKAKLNDILNIETVNKYMLQLCEELVRDSGLKAFNIPKACYCEIDIDWSTNPQLFTPTQKKRRSNFAKQYATEISQMWAQLDKQEGGHQQKYVCKEGYKIIYNILAILLFLAAIRFFISKQ